MNAVLSVLGKDSVGILSVISTGCYKYNANIIEVSQSILKDYFAMFMVVNIDDLNVEFSDFIDAMKEIGVNKNVDVHVMHEDIFNSMHKI